jgi:hypothetical protein
MRVVAAGDTVASRAQTVDRSLVWGAVMLGVYVLGVLPSLGQSLVESHAHRQTQTAYTALLYAEHGFDLFRPPLPILGPPGSIPQELPLFQALGAFVMRLGIPPDMAMRLAGVICFLGAAWLVYLLARRLLGTSGSLVALGAFLFNPIAWVYGRASLIEYLAVAGAVAFLYGAIRWMDERRAGFFALAAVGGLVAMTVKITTGAFLLLPILAWRAPSDQRGYRHASVWLLLAIAVGIGLLWSVYAQGVREETPAAAFLSLQNQLAWFFGTPLERLNPGAWRVPVVALLALTGSGLVLWAPLAVKRAAASGQRPFLIGLLLVAAIVPLLLFNLYAIHDYYWIAVSPVIALAIGLGAEWLIADWDRRWVRRAGVGLAGAWVATIIGLAPTWTIIYGTPSDEARAMRIAGFLHDHSEADDWIVQRGWGWEPTFLYYARRQGLAVPGSNPREAREGLGAQDLSEIDFDAILSDPIFGPFIRCDQVGSCVVEDGP